MNARGPTSTSPSPSPAPPSSDLAASARLARDALHGRAPAPAAERGARARQALRLYHSPAYRWGYAALMLGGLLLALVELPAPVARALSPTQVALVRAADFLVQLAVAFDLAVQATYQTPAVALRRGWFVAKLVTLLTLATNLVAHAASGGTVPYLARLLRPVLLVERLRNVRKIVASVVDTAPRIVNVGVLLVLNLIVHAVLGFVLFAGVQLAGPDGEPANCIARTKALPAAPTCSTMLGSKQACSDYFASLGESTIHLFELMTAVNFPTIAIPAMQCSYWAALFFVSFIVTAVYLLFNLALAVAYNEFAVGMRGEVLTRYARIFAGLDVVFRRLSGSNLLLLADAPAPLPSSALASLLSRAAAWGASASARASATSTQARAAARQVQESLVLARARAEVGLRLDEDAFTAFFLELRTDLQSPQADALGRLLFAAFAQRDGAATSANANPNANSNSEPAAGPSLLQLDSHAFRRLMISCALVRAAHRPAPVFVEDLLVAEEAEVLAVDKAGWPPTVGGVSISVSAGQAHGGAGGRPALAGAVAWGGTDSGKGEVFGLVVGAGAGNGALVAMPPDPALPLQPMDSSQGTIVRNPLAAFVAGAGTDAGTVAVNLQGPELLGPPAAEAGAAAAATSASRQPALAQLMDARRQRVQQAALATSPTATAAATPALLPSSPLTGAAAGEDESGLSRRERPLPLLEHAPRRSWALTWDSWADMCSRLVPVADSDAASFVFDFSTVVAALCVLTQLTIDTSDSPPGRAALVKALQDVQVATTTLGAFYVALRCLAWGPVRYWRRGALNRFDLGVMSSLGVAAIIASSGVPGAANYVLFLRFLRLARVFRFVPGFSSTVVAFISIFSNLLQLVLILLAVFYSFAIVGMTYFGGQLVASNEAVSNSSYGIYSYYDVINFDELPSAFFALFYLLSVNDWVVLMEGCVAAVGVSARAYFVVFWSVVVLFLLNVIIAVITVAFGAEKSRRDEADFSNGSRRAQRAVAALASSSTSAAEALEDVWGGTGVGSNIRVASVAEAVASAERARAAAAAAAAAGHGRAAARFVLGDWRGSLLASRVNLGGWLLWREPSQSDVYDALYREDIMATFEATFS